MLEWHKFSARLSVHTLYIMYTIGIRLKCIFPAQSCVRYGKSGDMSLHFRYDILLHVIEIILHV